MADNDAAASFISSDSWKSFTISANTFLQKTNEHVLQGLNPGGIYQAIWCRDASYILKDWFLSGNIDGAMQQIYKIWSHQISTGTEKLVYGRGSPQMKFSAEVAKPNKQKEFEGALPTTIYQAGFSEVYGQNPDIDSTALIISTTSWILARVLKEQEQNSSFSPSFSEPSSRVVASEHSSDYVSALLSKVGITDPPKVAEFVVPRMLRAIEHLNGRDVDDDGLLEQGHNEDWMDTAVRAGKIVYSQACWLLALNDLCSLLLKLGRSEESDKLNKFIDKTIHGVEQKLWSEQDGCYMDIQQIHHTGEPYRMLTQDVSFYLIAISQNTANDSLTIHHHYHHNDDRSRQTAKNQKQGQGRQEPMLPVHQSLHKRAVSTLDAIRNRAWKEKWPLITETELKRTGPWILKPYQYHNHTFWPWTTGIELLARSRFNKVEGCNILLSKLASEDGHPHLHAFYEWINPVTDLGNGAYPFRTGITAIRIALADILGKIKGESPSNSSM